MSALAKNLRKLEADARAMAAYIREADGALDPERLDYLARRLGLQIEQYELGLVE